jgi:hypothetical protein
MTKRVSHDRPMGYKYPRTRNPSVGENPQLFCVAPDASVLEIQRPVRRPVAMDKPANGRLDSNSSADRTLGPASDHLTGRAGQPGARLRSSL